MPLEPDVRSTLAVGPDALATWRLNTTSGVVEGDDAMLRLWGFEEGETLTLDRVLARVHPEDVDALHATFEKSLRDKAFYRAEYRIVLPDGTVRHIASSAKPLYDEQQTIYLSGLHWDVTEERHHQRALAASERLRRVALEAAEMGVWEIELATQTVRWDAYCRQLFGFEGDGQTQLTMAWAFEIVHPQDRAAVLQTLTRATQSPESARYSIEYRVRVRGEERWIRTVARCVFVESPDGPRPERLLGVNQDVTSRRREEERAFASAELSRIALESAELGTWELNLANDTVRWDTRCANLFGFPPSETIHVDETLDVMHPDDRPVVEAALAQALDPAGTGHYQAFFRSKDSNGGERWIRSVGQAHFSTDTVDGERKAERFFGVVMDDTARRLNEESIRRWHGVLEDGGWGVASIRPEVESAVILPQTVQARAKQQSLGDPDRLAELEASGLLDAPPSEVLDRITEMACRLLKVPISLISLVDDRRQFFAGQAGLQGEVACSRETPLTHSFCQHVTTSGAPLVVPDSLVNPVVKTSRAIQDLGVRAYLGVPLTTPQGYTVGALCSISDETREWSSDDLAVLQDLGQLVVTEITLRTYVRENQRAQAAAEAASRAKSEFLANMSHEIRTPMSAILGYADILANNESDPDNLELVETIRRNGRHLLEILNDILDLAKIESGKFEVRSDWFQVDDVIEEVISMLGVRAAEQGLGLSGRFLTEIPDRMVGDATRLRQILINLVGNAIKFTDSGSVSIEVCFDSQAQGLVIAVVDTGSGIHPHQIERLFEPFTQADSTAQRTHGGTGLGLTICRRFAAALGGSLTATSEHSTGSRFELRIPAGDLQDVAMRKVNEVHPGSMATRSGNASVSKLQDQEPLKGHSILVVDDRRELRTLVQMLLEEAGAKVSTAANGAEAVEAYRQSPDKFGAVLMDMQMPVMDGYTASTALRDMGATIPIVAVTAHALSGEQERCFAAGCNAYVTKPLDGAALLHLLSEFLNVEQEEAERG
ncbi:PAS domain-containing protein [Saltatorellus ferox]|uniref:PAS domain-containing protein n=1 Tax=Saltatorellus ferox TaxID=2528018 RepID=UPI003AF355A4